MTPARQDPDWQSKRSLWSGRFEVRVRWLALPDRALKVPLDVATLGEFATHLVVIDVDAERHRLPFRFVGAAINQCFGQRNLVDMNYLDLVAPSVREEAFDAMLLMVGQPSGLWQIVTGRANQGQSVTFEFTSLPVLTSGRGNNQLLLFLQLIDELQPNSAVVAIQQATAWHWIDLGAGEPLGDTVFVE